MRWVRFTTASTLAVLAGVFLVFKLGDREVQRLHEQVSELELERSRLVAFAERLSASRRVAQIDVVRQRRDRRGRLVTTMLWQEIGDDGTLGKPLAVEAIGSLVYFEALVLKFDFAHVGAGDEAKGTSLAMFRRIFGEDQAPESVLELDRIARPPMSIENAQAREQDALWARFWDLVDDAELAKEYGVRVAQVEAPAVPLRAGQIWEVSLDAAGGLNLRQLAVERRAQPLESAERQISGVRGLERLSADVE